MVKNKVDQGIFQKKCRFLTGSMLKWIAVVTMLVDHLAIVALKGYANAQIANLTREQMERWNMTYRCMRHIGRISFPLFAFLLVEGFYYTKNRKQYAWRLLLFALLSEVPYDLAIYGKVWDFRGQNVMFSLFLGLTVLSVVERIRKWTWKRRGDRSVIRQLMTLFLQIFTISAGAALAYLCRFDYTYKGIALVSIFYYFHSYRVSAAIAGFCAFSWNPYSLPAFLLLPFYNGRRGQNRQKWFYFFYPLHLLALYVVMRAIDFFCLP